MEQSPAAAFWKNENSSHSIIVVIDCSSSYCSTKMATAADRFQKLKWILEFLLKA